ncbi:MAG: hypothetical protein SPK03_08515 [Alloprevotella sp.]|nr:hypothetical protein [Alloprevotella sp.]
MRKITLYLSLLLTFLGVTANEALAQVSCVDLTNMTVGESKTVIMHVGGTNVNKFIGTFSSSNGSYYNDGKDNLNANASEYKYTIKKVSPTTISVKDSHEKYFNGFLSTNTNAKGHFTNTSTETSFTFEVAASPVNTLNASYSAYTLTYAVENGDQIQYITSVNRLGVKTGTAITFQFVESTDLVEGIAFSCTDTNNGQYNFSTSVNALVGQTLNDMVTAALSTASGTYTLNSTHDGNVSVETTAIDINLTSTYNFPVKMNTPYFLQCRYLPNGYGDKSNSFPFFMQRLGSNSTNTAAANKTFDLNQIWLFERVTTSPNEVIVRNMGSKTGETYNGITGTDGVPTYTANPTAYVLANHNATTDAFSLHVAGTNSYLGGHNAGATVPVSGSSINARLSVWTDNGAANDNGSAFNAIEVTWSDLAAGIPNLQEAAEAATNLTRYVSSEYATTISDKTEDVTIEEIASAFDNAPYTSFTLNTDNYYLLYSAKSGFNNYYAYANPRANKAGTPIDDNRKFYLSTNASIPQALLKFEAVEGASTYYIEHVNSGLFVCQPRKNNEADLPVSKADADKFSLEMDNRDKTIWSIKGNKNSIYLNFFSGWAEKPLGGWDQNSTSDPGSGFRIVRVDAIPVALSSAGWSTITLPVAVTIPSGVHAYYITRNEGTVVYVEEITRVIPAKTPVLLNGTASTTYNFPITTTSEAAPANNKLLGTTMARKGFSTDDTGTPDVYGLYVNETTASFVPAFSDVVPANKAVLPYANIDFTDISSNEQASALSLSFDDITGISFVNASQSKGDIFDLQGRRVLYPVRGQVYIQNGQKFIIK